MTCLEIVKSKKKKNAVIICYILTTLVSLQWENVKKSKNLTKILTIERGNIFIF